MARPPASTHTRPPRRRRGSGGAHMLARDVEKLIKPIFGKQGLVHGAIVTNWGDIVGDQLARHTQPEKITFSKDGVSGGVLTVRIASGALAMEVQHSEPQIVERINRFFGYKAVVRLKLIQAPISRREAPPKKPPHELTADEKHALAEATANVDDPELKAALDALGKAVMGRKASPKRGD